MAEELVAAGLRRVTVSLDALDDATFRAVSDTTIPVQAVLDGIAAARPRGSHRSRSTRCCSVA
jgi:GTP 3',8-cyclase